MGYEYDGDVSLMVEMVILILYIVIMQSCVTSTATICHIYLYPLHYESQGFSNQMAKLFKTELFKHKCTKDFDSRYCVCFHPGIGNTLKGLVTY